MTPHLYFKKSIADQLPNEYWDSLGINGPFLWLLFMSQHKQVQQLRDTNTFLQGQVTNTHDDITNVASATASAVAQAIVTNPQASIPIQSTHHLNKGTRAADPEPFDGNRDKMEEFVWAIQIVVTMQADTFADERMKFLYALCFMHGGMAQVWAANK